MPKILYLNLMVSPKTGDIFKSGVWEALAPVAIKANCELMSLDVFKDGKSLGLKNLADQIRQLSPDALIVSGSEKNITDTEDRWVQEFLQAFREILDVPKEIREWMGPPFPVFGICFGHQALAQLLGGEVSTFRRKVGQVDLKVLVQARRHPVMGPLVEGRDFIPGLVTHADQVIRLPQNFHRLLTSDYCDVQAMAHDRFPIFSVQSHPEITERMRVDSDDQEVWASLSSEELKTHPGSQMIAGFGRWALRKFSAVILKIKNLPIQ